jgi:hypothetical protein
MSSFTNSHGQTYRTDIGGTYPVNDSDPQNVDDEFDAAEYQRARDYAMDRAAEAREQRD